jgi:predicted ester cyclase
MSREKNVAAQMIGGEIAVSHDVSRFNEVMAADVVDHDPAVGQAPGVEGIKDYWRELFESFPDLKLDVDAFLADEEYVTLVYRLSGTHLGNYMGHPPTGQALRGALIAGGQIRERPDGRTVGIDGCSRDPHATRRQPCPRHVNIDPSSAPEF